MTSRSRLPLLPRATSSPPLRRLAPRGAFVAANRNPGPAAWGSVMSAVGELAGCGHLTRASRISRLRDPGIERRVKLARLRGALRALCGVSPILAAAGCGGAPATPTSAVLSDPNEIVTTGVGRLGAASSLHIDGTINGTINAASLGTISGGSMTDLSGSVKLDGSSMSGDVDLVNRASTTGRFPASLCHHGRHRRGRWLPVRKGQRVRR
jgi:hypothetical protein